MHYSKCIKNWNSYFELWYRPKVSYNMPICRILVQSSLVIRATSGQPKSGPYTESSLYQEYAFHSICMPIIYAIYMLIPSIEILLLVKEYFWRQEHAFQFLEFSWSLSLRIVLKIYYFPSKKSKFLLLTA